MAPRAKDLGQAASGLLQGTKVRGDDTVTAAPSGGVRGGRTSGGKRKLAAYVDPAIYDALEAMAAEQDRSVSWLVAAALREYLARRG